MLKVEDLLLLKCCVEGERRLTWAYIEGMAYYGATRSFLDSVPLTENAGAFLPENRWIDINTEEDWMRAESMYAALNWTRVP
jgi:CMP-N-acetylneuraminic acid synthetase